MSDTHDSVRATIGSSPRLRWWQYVGPWPIRPLPVTIFTALFFAATALGSAILESEIVANVSFAEQAISVLAGAAVAWSILWLARRWQVRQDLGLPAYLVAFLVSSILAVLARSVIGGVSDVVLSSPVSFVATILRIFIPLLTINSIIGVSTTRLQHQVARAEDALALAREQQEWLLDADERARRQVADTLHDRVQASLIAACLQLQATDPSDRRAIDGVINRLEELRKVDVRRAARALSPTLSEVGLASSLSELASQYEPGMVTLVDVDARMDTQRRTDERTRLGIYRIVEQALLNSAVHGHAHICNVRIVDGEQIVISVEDDGRGFAQGDTAIGSGAALISTWVRALGGHWSWGNSAAGGAEVRVTLSSGARDDGSSGSHL